MAITTAKISDIRRISAIGEEILSSWKYVPTKKNWLGTVKQSYFTDGNVKYPRKVFLKKHKTKLRVGSNNVVWEKRHIFVETVISDHRIYIESHDKTKDHFNLLLNAYNKAVKAGQFTLLLKLNGYD